MRDDERTVRVECWWGRRSVGNLSFGMLLLLLLSLLSAATTNEPRSAFALASNRQMSAAAGQRQTDLPR